MTRSARRFLFVLAALLPGLAACGLRGAEPLFSEDFSGITPGDVPGTFLILGGDYAVREEGGERFLESPGAPLDSFGLMFGPARQEDWGAEARFQGTGKGRRFPAFGVSINGVAGYRVEVAPAKRALELLKGDLVKASVPFAWTSGEWTRVRVQIRKVGEQRWQVEGKAWPEGAPEPEGWMVTWEETAKPVTGRAAVWGKPFSGTPIRYDDLKIVGAAS